MFITSKLVFDIHFVISSSGSSNSFDIFRNKFYCLELLLILIKDAIACVHSFDTFLEQGSEQKMGRKSIDDVGKTWWLDYCKLNIERVEDQLKYLMSYQIKQ